MGLINNFIEKRVKPNDVINQENTDDIVKYSNAILVIKKR